MNTLLIRTSTALHAYLPTWQAMQQFTQQRTTETLDELWLLEHHPVFTQGLAGKAEHVLNPGDIPVIQTDRGGQVTYHGPGQLMAYSLFDLRRLEIGIRTLVQRWEQVIIDLMTEFNVTAERKEGAPGIYIDGAKLCSIGLRVKRGCSYHGIALNVGMDLSPFKRINPCGFSQLAMTDIQRYAKAENIATIRKRIVPHILRLFNYNQAQFADAKEQMIYDTSDHSHVIL